MVLNNTICKKCGIRCITGGIYCSQSCANYDKASSNISTGLKKYYKSCSKDELKQKNIKISNTVNKMYSLMSPEEIKKHCVNKNAIYTAFTNFSEKFPTLTLDCTEEFFYTNKHIPII